MKKIIKYLLFLFLFFGFINSSFAYTNNFINNYNGDLIQYDDTCHVYLNGVLNNLGEGCSKTIKLFSNSSYGTVMIIYGGGHSTSYTFTSGSTGIGYYRGDNTNNNYYYDSVGHRFIQYIGYWWLSLNVDNFNDVTYTTSPTYANAVYDNVGWSVYSPPNPQSCHTDIKNYPYKISQKFNSGSTLIDFNVDTISGIGEINYTNSGSLNKLNLKVLNANSLTNFSTGTLLNENQFFQFTGYNLTFGSDTLSSYLYGINKSHPIIKLHSDTGINYINIKGALIGSTYDIFDCSNNNILSENLVTNKDNTFSSIDDLCIEFGQGFFQTNYIYDIDYGTRETQFLNTEFCTDLVTGDVYVDGLLFTGSIDDPGGAAPNTTFIDTLNNDSLVCESGDIQCSINKYFISSGSLIQNNLNQINTTGSGFINITPGSTLNNISTISGSTDKCSLINTNTMTFNYYSNGNVGINFSLQNLPLLDNSVGAIADKLTGVFIGPINGLIGIVSLIIPFTQETKNYCLFGQIISIEQHKLFVGTDDYQKMNFFDYLVLFGLSVFLYYKFIRQPLVSHPYNGSLTESIDKFKSNQHYDKQWEKAFGEKRR